VGAVRVGDRSQETGDRRQKTGVKRKNTGDRRSIKSPLSRGDSGVCGSAPPLKKGRGIEGDLK